MSKHSLKQLELSKYMPLDADDVLPEGDSTDKPMKLQTKLQEMQSCGGFVLSNDNQVSSLL